MTPALRLEDAVVRLGGRLALDRVCVSVRPGEMVGVVGLNGAGKTTLLRAGLGLVSLEAGLAELGGAAVSGLGALSSRQSRRVSSAGKAGGLEHAGLASPSARSTPPARAEALARAALERVGLAALADRGVLSMSGGERGRVLLARLLTTGRRCSSPTSPPPGSIPGPSCWRWICCARRPGWAGR